MMRKKRIVLVRKTEQCPDCGGFLVPGEGCVLCPVCGYSRCG